MKKAVYCLVVFALAVGLLTLLTPTDLKASPLNSNGKGACKQNNKHCLKWCGLPPAGCDYFECTKCGCDFICENGEIISR